MAKYRKRPVVIEAEQLKELTFIQTLEGTMQGNPGDWLVIGVNGERYPVKPDIFEKTYELVEDEEVHLSTNAVLPKGTELTPGRKLVRDVPITIEKD